MKMPNVNANKERYAKEIGIKVAVKDQTKELMRNVAGGGEQEEDSL
jgi:hypothetical protein